LDDACQLPKGIVAPGDAVQLPALEGSRLDGRRRDDVAHLLEILLLEVVEAFLASAALILARSSTGSNGLGR
jgi:predicted thioredoxin/glutaredoxin